MDRTTVAKWEQGEFSNVKDHKAKPDYRVKLSPEKKEELIRRTREGESQRVLADEYKIAPGRVSQIITA